MYKYEKTSISFTLKGGRGKKIMEKIFCTYSKDTVRTYRWDTMIGHAPLVRKQGDGSLFDNTYY